MKRALLIIGVLLCAAIFAIAGNNKQAFIENKGQIYNQDKLPVPQVQFLLNQPNMNVQLKQNGFSYDTYVLTSKTAFSKAERQHNAETSNYNYHRIDINFIGANTNPTIVKEDIVDQLYHYYNVPFLKEGITNVNGFRKVTYQNIYPGIDIEYIIDNEVNPTFKYNFIVHPGADISLIKMAFNSGIGSQLSQNKIEIGTSNGTIVETIPASYLLGNQAQVKVSYTAIGNGVYGFAAENYNHSQTLVIDPIPTRLWGTYFGSTADDRILGSDIGNNDAIYVAGYSSSTNLATTGVFQTALVGTIDGMLARFSNAGQLVWCTYIGDAGFQELNSVSYGNGQLFVGGYTDGTTLATSGAAQTNYGGGTYDCFIARMDTNGQRVWATYLGGNALDMALTVEADNDNNVYVGGYTSSSSGLHTLGSFRGVSDAFIAKYSSTGQKLWARLHGGAGYEAVTDITFDLQGRPLVAGYTTSTNNINIIATGSHRGGEDMFVLRLTHTGGLSRGNYVISGSGEERAYGIAVDSDGEIVICGFTENSTNLASVGAYQSTLDVYWDGIVAKLDSNLSRVWATYYGGTLLDEFYDICIDAQDNIIVYGEAGSSGLASVGAYKTFHSNPNINRNQLIMVKFDNDGSRLWGTYYGGSSSFFGGKCAGITINSNNEIVFAGTTDAAGYASSGTHSLTNSGSNDGFIAKFQDQCNNITLNDTVANVSCIGGNDGSIRFSIAGGTAPYTFIWSNSQTSNPMLNLPANSYKVTITDASDCIATKTVVVSQPDSIRINFTLSPPSCYGYNNGSISASPTGGTPPYSFLWSTSSTDTIINGLTDGSFSVTVTDANGCSRNSSVNLTQPAIFTATIAPQGVSCNGASDGSLSTAITGGTANFSYLWSDGQVTQSATNLSAGNYTVTVTDANGCTISANSNVTQPTALTAQAVLVRNVICKGEAQGSARVTYQGGTAPYTINWSNNLHNDSITNVLAGFYSVTVIDANGCSQSDTITITEPNAVLAPSAVVNNNASCFGLSNGGATAMATGGLPPYSYLWSNSASTQSPSNLAAGNATVTVTDALGCKKSASVTITQPAQISISFTNVSQASCNGGSDGAATASAANGNAPYTYQWSNGNNSATATGLSARQYTVTVTDASGCSVTKNISISSPLDLQVNLTVQNESCEGSNSGSINTTVTGGTQPYTYSWSNGLSGSGNHINVAPGVYVLTVTDSKGCTENATATLTMGQALDGGFIYGPNNASLIDTLSYSIDVTNLATYNWFATGGDIVAGQGSTTAWVAWANTGNLSVSCVVSLSGCSDTVTKQVSVITSNEDLLIENVISIYPNPTSDIVSIKLPNTNGLYNIELFDIYGKLIMTNADIPNTYQINLSHLANGIYLLAIKGTDKTTYHKLEKVN